RLDRLGTGSDTNRDGHQPAIQRNVEQFLSVAAPARLGTTIGGHLCVASWVRKGLDVNLIPAGLVRLICDPFSVGRKLCQILVKVRLDNGKWFRISIHG